MSDKECVSVGYFNTGTERRRILTIKFPLDDIYHVTTQKLWVFSEHSFTRTRIEKFERYVFFSKTKKRSEMAEQFGSILKTNGREQQL